MRDSDFEFYHFSLNALTRLADRTWIFQYLPKYSVGAELGVFRGLFSEFILEKLQPKIFYMIDPWTKLGPVFNWGTIDYTALNKLTTEYAKKESCARISRFTSTLVEIHEEYSYEFFPWLEREIQEGRKESLDFVYIDAAHRYELVLKDLQLSATVLKKNGMIAGDDWWPYHKSPHHGVCRAVNEFIKHNDFEMVAAGRGGQFVLRKTPDHDTPH